MKKLYRYHAVITDADENRGVSWRLRFAFASCSLLLRLYIFPFFYFFRSPFSPRLLADFQTCIYKKVNAFKRVAAW